MGVATNCYCINNLMGNLLQFEFSSVERLEIERFCDAKLCSFAYSETCVFNDAKLIGLGYQNLAVLHSKTAKFWVSTLARVQP